MDTSDLTPGMQDMMAEMAAMRAELNELKTRANALTSPPSQPQPVQEARPVASTTRRKALLKLGGGLVAAGLGASLPTFNVSAGPGSVNSGVNPNATPLVASNGSVTQTFAGINFRPAYLPSYDTYATTGVGGIQWAGGANGFYCPLVLPQGVKVTNVTFYYTNNAVSNPGNPMGFVLIQINPITATISTPVDLLSTTPLAYPLTISATGTAANPVVTIDNTLYSYLLGVNFVGNQVSGNPYQTLWGAKITYVNITGHFQAQ